MPIIYIHGVNTRRGYEYDKDLAARDKLLQRLILDPLAAKEERFKGMKIVNPYWGDEGVKFMWNQATLPEVGVLEDLGASDEETPESDFQFTETVKGLADPGRRSSPQLETLGPEEGAFKRAAEKDLTRFVESVLSPLFLSEMQLADDAKAAPEAEGVLQAQLAIAGAEVARDPRVKAEVAAAGSDDEVIDLLKQKVQARIEQLALAETVKPVDERVEALGSVEDFKDRIGELFDRAKGAPGRVLTLSALERFREGLHRNLSRFLGDVFVYLSERGDQEKPGPIISIVLSAIRNAPRNHPDEPLIILTHSMGGNILYDILTYYDTKIKVDIWVSVASQVGQFEEMKIFKSSNKELGGSMKVTGLKPRVGYWLNIYDPADVLSFKTAPVFADVSAEEKYLTGESTLKAHGEYFGRASFYQMLQKHIEGARL